MKTPANKQKIFNDPVHGFISLPYEIIFDIIEHPYFQRLRRIKQLGLTDFVYPGAIHTRFHHALGAFHLMNKAIAVLRIKGVKISKEEEIGACISILLHDIGHGPFSHTLEYVLIPKVHHEKISSIFLQQLNKEFKGKLSTAIRIFEGTHPKKFLHQLVSSQLDTDRLDYITRDSFFTGVNEGTIAYDRIIEMMQVVNNDLVVEQKGLYSVENFLIARRLMYWQVYLHKTVLSAEYMLINAIKRAKFLIQNGVSLESSDSLQYFLTRHVTLSDFKSKKEVLEHYAELDDTDIIIALKSWGKHDDFVLSRLANGITQRKLFKVEMRETEFSKKEVDQLKTNVSKSLNISIQEAEFMVIQESTKNSLYDPLENQIKLVDKSGKLKDISKAADLLNISVLNKPAVKHFICYPKHLI